MRWRWRPIPLPSQVGPYIKVRNSLYLFFMSFAPFPYLKVTEKKTTSISKILGPIIFDRRTISTESKVKFLWSMTTYTIRNLYRLALLKTRITRKTITTAITTDIPQRSKTTIELTKKFKKLKYRIYRTTWEESDVPKSVIGSDGSFLLHFLISQINFCEIYNEG